MLSAGAWLQDQANTILFVMVDSGGTEVPGLGTGFTLEISKNGGAFSAGIGTKSEVGSGWYKYVTTAGEADTRGPVAVKVTHASTIQQNLEYVVEGRNAEAIEFTYTLTDSSTGDPIEGASIWICSDSGGTNVLWAGTTNSLGVAVDENSRKPWLDAGTYYIFRQKTGYIFSDPDTEVIS